MPDIEVMKKYVKTVTDILDLKGGKGLSTTERRLGTKLKETQSELRGLDESIDRTRKTIQQAQQHLDMTTRDHLQLVSKAAGFVESLITLKFGDEIEEEEAKRRVKEAVEKKAQKKEAKSKGNSTTDPSPPQKSKKRTKKSKRTQPAT